jgi:hypothetical protein
MSKARPLKVKSLLVTVLASAGFAVFLAPSAALAAEPEHKFSIDCEKPKDAKSNYSWSEGTISVTVYFNNHCAHKVKAKLVVEDTRYPDTYTESCMVTNGGTKGKKKFKIGAVNVLKEIKEADKEDC